VGTYAYRMAEEDDLRRTILEIPSIGINSALGDNELGCTAVLIKLNLELLALLP